MQQIKINESRYTVDEALDIVKGTVISKLFSDYEELKKTDRYENLMIKWNDTLLEKQQRLTYKENEWIQGSFYDEVLTVKNSFSNVDVFNEIILVAIQNDMEKYLSILIEGICNSVDNEFGTSYCINVVENYIENKLSTRIAYIGEELSHPYENH